jgi:hypothetical protein
VISGRADGRIWRSNQDTTRSKVSNNSIDTHLQLNSLSEL